MPASYIVRNERGESVFKISNRTANKIIDGAEGHFREYRTPNNVAKTVYHLAENYAVHTPEITLFFWKDYILIPGEK